MKKKKGFTLIELLVVIAIIAMLLAILMPALGKVKKLAMRLVCGTNLKGMANALQVYAYDYRDDFPVQGGRGSNVWTRWDDLAINYWNNPSYNWSLLNSGTYRVDELTVSSSLYMLVKIADVGVKSFICSGGEEEAMVNGTDHDIVELNDFGNVPKDHCSYSYQMPYSHEGVAGDRNYPATGTSNPANAVMADKNPWFDSKFPAPGKQDATNATGSRTDPEAGDRDSINANNFFDMVALYDIVGEVFEKQVANSGSHDREGQNVLFGDGHVSFEKTPNVGARYDNIYTSAWDGTDPYSQYAREVGYPMKTVGIAPSQTKDDSLLVNDDDGLPQP